MKSKGESLARFIYTIRPLQEVYTLPPTSLHIFYDRAGDLIAFNRNASLFLNLRFFEQWRKGPPWVLTFRGDLIPTFSTDDQEVATGNLLNAYTSWCVRSLSFHLTATDLPFGVQRYFTLAHEIAHNLVQAHNSEHEFCFSSICEQYLPAFVKLIGQSPA